MQTRSNFYCMHRITVSKWHAEFLFVFKSDKMLRQATFQIELNVLLDTQKSTTHRINKMQVNYPPSIKSKIKIYHHISCTPTVVQSDNAMQRYIIRTTWQSTVIYTTLVPKHLSLYGQTFRGNRKFICLAVPIVDIQLSGAACGL